MWRNSQHSYGLIQILLHWTTAILVTGMFALGIYMVDLGYYDPWYHRAPALHKSVGLLVIGLFLFRLVWRFGDPQPEPLGVNPWSRKAAGGMHLLLYLGLFALLASGYLIASADGRSIPVFDVFSVPALTLPVENQEELAGDVHEVTAWSLMVLAVLHGAAALKHRFIDKDASLARMLWPRRD
ncbi:cytochrome b [Proteobacteria bacterium 005FR1]|nr:cytochrome b [Proteobacteria bacterium 005FR1]